MSSKPTSPQQSQYDGDDAEPGDDIVTGTAPAGGDELANIRKERDELFERLARTTAEFKNSQRRLEADRDQALGFANERLLKSLLPVVDNFDRAMAHDGTTADAASLLKGLEMVHEELLKVLKKYELDVIAPSVGDDFDAAKHEALVQQESNLPAGRITLVIAKGYSLKGRILRPAQVALSKGA